MCRKCVFVFVFAIHTLVHDNDDDDDNPTDRPTDRTLSSSVFMYECVYDDSNAMDFAFSYCFVVVVFFATQMYTKISRIHCSVCAMAAVYSFYRDVQIICVRYFTAIHIVTHNFYDTKNHFAFCISIYGHLFDAKTIIYQNN